MNPSVLVLNGPNLNLLGTREPEVYGATTLAEIDAGLAAQATDAGCELSSFQSNHEGSIVDFIQESSAGASGIIINAGALTQGGYSILDALLDAGLPFIEVHLSTIHGRERFRRRSVFASKAVGQMAGFGPAGYIYALDHLVSVVNG